MQSRRGRVRDRATNDWTVLFPWNFPLTLLTPERGSVHKAFDGKTMCSVTGHGCTGYSVYQVWDGGVRGVNDMSAVDIGSLCMLTPPVNSLASQIFCNIPSNHR